MFVLMIRSELSESEQDKEEQVYLLQYTLHVLITHDIGHPQSRSLATALRFLILMREN